MANVRMISLNVQGLNDNQKKKTSVLLPKQKQFQICLLHETHSSGTIRNFWQNQLGHNIYFSHGTTASKGVCVIIIKNFKCEITEVISDTEGRWLICNLKTEET